MEKHFESEVIKLTAKEYLSQLRWIQQNIESLKEEIEDLEYTISLSGVSYDGIRVQSSHGNIQEDKIIKLSDAKQKLVDEVIRYHDVRDNIIDTIDSLEDPIEAIVLKYRYVRMMPCWKIEQRIGYSRRQFFRIYRSAHEHIEKLAPHDT